MERPTEAEARERLRAAEDTIARLEEALERAVTRQWARQLRHDLHGARIARSWAKRALEKVGEDRGRSE